MKNTIGKKFNFFSLLKFTFPTIIMMIVTALYTIIDSIFVSNVVGTDALSAINIVFPVFSIVIAIAIMLGTGGSAIIARKLGDGDEKTARENLSLIYLVGLVVGIIILIIGIAFIKPIIYGLGGTDNLYGYCKDYLFIMLLFMPSSIIQMLNQTFLVTAGKPSLGLWLSIGAGVANVVLDYIFIFEMGLGIKGAAIATGIGYTIAAVGGVWFLLSKRSNLYFVKPKFDGKVLFETCTNGSSEMVANLAIAITTFLFNILMMKYLGENGVAAITIILYVQFLINAVFMGFSMGVAPVISYNYGEENYEQIKKIFKYCIIFILASSIMAYGISVVFEADFVRLFTEKGSDVYNIAVKGFSIFSINFLFAGVNIFATAMFTAFSNGKVSAIISFLRTFVFITAGLVILPMIFAANGVWVAMAVAEFLSMIVSIVYLYKYRKEYQY